MEKLAGNENAYQTLAAYLHGGRLPHALLIEGPAGCGKKTFARQVAQGALCAADRELRPCGVCRHCAKVEKDIHPDLLCFGGEGGARSFHIDVVRALRQAAFVRPNEAQAKAMLIQDVHTMSPQAQNALLKIIEEPPRGVVFVLTCENKAALLETILSRVAVIELAIPSVEQCAARLEKLRPGSEEGQRKKAAGSAGGNVGKALSLLEGDGQEDHGVGELLYNACMGSELDALAFLSAYERNRQGMTMVLEGMAAALRDLLLHPPAQGDLAKLSTRAGRLRLLKILAIIEDTTAASAQNASGLLLATAMCAKIRSVLADG